MNTNRISHRLAALAIVGGLFLPLFVSAETTITSATPSTFCTKFDTRAGDLEKTLADRTAKLDKAQQDQIKKISDRRNTENGKLEKKRADADKDYEQSISQLETKAKTQAEKDAVAAFKTALSTALTTRRAAIDAAITAFRDGVDLAVTERQAAMKSLISTLVSDVNAATKRAQDDCAAKVAPAKVQASFRTALANARKKFETAHKALPKVDTKIQALQKTQQQAFTASQAAFKTSVTAARNTLKASIGKK